MKYFRELTEWTDNPNADNHVYYMDDNKTFAVGYLKSGKGKLIKFSRPMRIDVRGRKFVVENNKKSEPDEMYFGKKEEPKNVIKVQGSNGKEYLIEKIGSKYTCTCPGYTFRGKCKHVESMK